MSNIVTVIIRYLGGLVIGTSNNNLILLEIRINILICDRSINSGRSSKCNSVISSEIVEFVSIGKNKQKNLFYLNLMRTFTRKDML